MLIEKPPVKLPPSLLTPINALNEEAKKSRLKRLFDAVAAIPDYGRRFCRTVFVTISVGALAGTAAAQQQLEPMTVTATKLEESMQEVPVAVTALDETDLKALNIENLSDYIEYLPNVTTQGTGPGQQELFIRGAATSQTIITLSSVQGLQPSVALYVDEQPVALQGRNLDVYATDLERIEVLPGPQGTLFGASSQSGTVRLITNKPDFAGYDASVSTSVSTTDGGEMSMSIEGMYNIPVNDKLALRIAGYADRQGGWIDNILNDPDEGGWNGSAVVIDRISGGVLPDPENQDITIPRNDQLVEDDFNDATYAGVRLSATYLFNDDWELNLQHTQQSLDTEGVWAYDPNLEGESSVNRFAPDENEDDFGLTTWTVEGRLEQLDIIYAGGYLDREINSTIDYTFYTNGGLFSAYYVFYDGGGAPFYAETGFDPSKFYKEDSENTRFTQELRVSTDPDLPVRGLVGLFYDEQELASVGKFKIASTDSPHFADLARTLPDVEGTNTDGGPFGPEFSFVNDVTRTTTQYAGFGQLEWEPVEDKLTLSASARYYTIDDEYKGATTTVNVTERLRAFGDGSLAALQDALGDSAGQAAFDAIQAGELDVADLDDDGILTVDDVILKFSIDYKLTEDVLLFATYAEGFRPPVTNRVGGGAARSGNPVFEDFRIPVYSETDELTNYEIGFKGDFFDRTLRLNVTGFYSEISDLQTSRFDPTNISFLWFADNVGDAEITGIDGEFFWNATDRLSINGAFTWLDSELTSLDPELEGIVAPVGSELPYSAPFSANVRARYEFDVPQFGEFQGYGYVRGGLSYTGDSYSGLKMDAYVVEDTAQRVYQIDSTGLSIEREADAYLGAPPNTELQDFPAGQVPGGRYIQESYVTANFAVGLVDTNWTAEVFVENLTNEEAQLYIDTQQFTPKVVTNRPRTIGFRFSYDFQ